VDHQDEIFCENFFSKKGFSTDSLSSKLILDEEKMALTNFIVRRIFLSDELESIKEMQINAKEFIDHYPRHREWLDMAINDVLNGKRVAFGVFKYGLDKRKRHSYELVGSIILKKNPYSRIVQLKNLYIKPEERGNGYGSALYAEAEQFSNRTGFELISTEVPFSESRTINFLHKHGYVVVSKIESRFKDGDLIYTMEKSLTPCYGGDPFDIRDIGKWILSIFYKLTINDTNNNIIFYQLSIEQKLAKEILDDKFRIKGAAFFLENTDKLTLMELLDVAKKHRSLIVFSRYTSAEIERICREKLMPLIDGQSIKKQFSSNSSLPLFPFDFPDIAGMIISIKSSLFKRITENQFDSFVYFKGGPTGKYLKENDIVAIYSELSEDDPEEGLRGIAKISDIKLCSPQEAWKFATKKRKLFTKQEFDRFTAGKDHIIAMELTDFYEIDRMTIDEIIEELFDGKEITWEIGHTYLSKSMVQKVLKRKKIMHTKYHVALSYASEDRRIADELANKLKARGIRVFYDSFEQATLWGKDLYQYFQTIFREKAEFSIPIISHHYAQKRWTSHELKQMQARSFNENREYILPLRLDDTDIPGINDTTGYIDLRNTAIDEVVQLVLEKLRQFQFIK
jgi:ribosomal protein S18 acetylase RimI-like enzyme/predicted transcriptional regulator